MTSKGEVFAPSGRSSSVAARGGAGAFGVKPNNRGRGASGVNGNGALRSARGNGCENSAPNMGAGKNTRRSPRLGGACKNNAKRPTVADTSNRNIFNDITNVAGGATSDMDKPKPVRQQNSTASVQQPFMLAAEATDPQSVEEYAQDISCKLFEDETTFLPRPDYMGEQTDITAKMRAILMDWLIEVHMKYKLRLETLHLTVNLIDRYLSKQQVSRKRLQLVGVAAMFIASKYEEINPPELHDWVYITNRAYTNKDVLLMECTMLTALSFNIMVPTAAHFFDLIAKANGCDGDCLQRNVALYLLDLGILDIRMLNYTPSHMVSAAMLLSNELCRRGSPVWPEEMCKLTNLTEAGLRECVGMLRELLEVDQSHGGGQLQAVHKKYSTTGKGGRHGVAKMAF